LNFFGPPNSRNKTMSSMQFKIISLRTLAALYAALACSNVIRANEPTVTTIAVGSKFIATDTLNCGDELNDDAKQCVEGLRWKPASFNVELQPSQPGCGDFLVRFPSARPVGNTKNDLVAMEWFPARDAENKICPARAMVVVHESASRMTIGRIIARGLSGQALHAFLIHLPTYGERRDPEFAKTKRALTSLPQAIADVRRARDAVAALPMIDRSRIGVQGTSLGGFVTATVAGLDHGYDRAFIMLAGGNLQDVILNGTRDAIKVHAKLTAAGLSDIEIKDLTRQIEPLRVASRIRAEETWLYSGKFDTVVPPHDSLAWATAAQLPESHHVEFPADHYSGIVYLPQLIDQIRQEMGAVSENAQTPESASTPTAR
jgi:dienelactone hydrolase